MARYTTPEDIKSRFLAGSRLFCWPRSPELLLEVPRAKEPADATTPLGGICCDRATLDCNRLGRPAFVRARPHSDSPSNFDRLVVLARSKFRVGEG
jgi:hypothetical protein